MRNRFPPEVSKKLGFYVYRLIDPRNGETFYIGKGANNRVFHHVSAMISIKELDENGEDKAAAKLDRIREILTEGLEVIHVIQRHSMDETEALHVEGALIDAFPGLSNIQGGNGNSDYGAMHVEAIVRKYQAPRLTRNHRIVFFTLRRDSVRSLGAYEACRGIWRMSMSRARRAELAMPVMEGIVIDVFEPKIWLKASVDDFPLHTRYDVEGRIGFSGRQANEATRKMYVGHRLRVRGYKDAKSRSVFLRLVAHRGHAAVGRSA
jgi:hypothetical protein